MPKVTNTYRIAEDVDAVIKADAKKLKTSQADIIERSVEKAHPMLMDEHRIEQAKAKHGGRRGFGQGSVL
jgi:hypothetical protein